MPLLRRKFILTLVLGVMSTVIVAWVATARTWLSSGVATNPSWARAKLGTPVAGVGGSVDAAPRTWHSGSQRVGAMHQCISWTSNSQALGQISAVLANASTMIQVDPNVPTTDAPPPFWSIPKRRSDIVEPADGFAYYEEVAAGWPFPALRWSRSVVVRPTRTTVTRSGVWETPTWARGYVKAHALPFVPIALGFAADTILFAIAWFVLLFGFSMLRQLRRHAAGHCPKCGYDLRGDLKAGCPECGWNRFARAA